MNKLDRELLKTTYCLAVETRALLLMVAARLGLDLKTEADAMQEKRPEGTL